jgi:hypothetical protein
MRGGLVFHPDHFKPRSYSIDNDSAQAVERFADMTRSSPYAPRLSLFYSEFIPYPGGPAQGKSSSREVIPRLRPGRRGRAAAGRAPMAAARMARPAAITSVSWEARLYEAPLRYNCRAARITETMQNGVSMLSMRRWCIAIGRRRIHSNVLDFREI